MRGRLCKQYCAQKAHTHTHCQSSFWDRFEMVTSPSPPLYLQSTDKLERDRLILFLNKLILNKKNVKEVMDSNGVRILVDLLTLAHLHTSRATVPLQVGLHNCPL